MDALDKQLEINQLLDYYQALLTDKQKNVMQYYYKQDYSLSEIAEIENVSRTAIHDTLKKVVVKLYEYEEKLQLVSKSAKRQTILHAMRKESLSETMRQWLDELEKVE